MIKNLLLKMELEGYGLVNMDSSDQKYIIDAFNIENLMGHKKDNNVLYAKKFFYKNETSDKINYNLKISRDVMLKNAFERDMISQTPNIVHHDAIFYSFIASPIALIRGYTFMDENITKSGAITLCDAEQISESISTIEVCSRSGKKNKDIDTTDNTFFYKENVGKIKYETNGCIDLMKLQFLACDEVFGRYTFNPDKFNIFKDFLSKKMPNFKSELGYYQLISSSVNIGEYGVLLSNENILFLVKEALKRLLGINIMRKGSYAKVNSLKIKLVENPIEDTLNDEYGWIKLSTEKEINELDFNSEIFYELVDENEEKLKRRIIDKKLDEIKANKKAKVKAEKGKKIKNEEIKNGDLNEINENNDE